MYKVFDGLKVQQMIIDTVTKEVTLTDYANSLCVFNDGVADVVVAVNGISITSKPGDSPIDECFEPFKKISITTTGGSYRIIVRG